MTNLNGFTEEENRAFAKAFENKCIYCGAYVLWPAEIHLECLYKKYGVQE